MAKDDDLLPEDQPAENLLPEEKMGAEAPAAAPVAEAPAAPASPVAAEISAKPRSNVWTLLMLITMVAMFAGMYVQLRELNEIYKVNVPIIGQKGGESDIPPTETTAPAKEGEVDTGGAAATEDPATPPAPPAADPAKEAPKTGDQAPK